MYNLIYSEEIDRDLTAIFNYIAEDSEIRASEYLGKIEACILHLQKNPELGRIGKYPELQRLGVRVLPFENYLILYTISEKNQSVSVLRVIHGSVNYKRLF